MADNNDIITKLLVLNHHVKKLAENESLHELYREAFTRCEDLTLKAANEIERLRNEVVSLTDELEKTERDKFEHGGAWGSYFGK